MDNKNYSKRVNNKFTNKVNKVQKQVNSTKFNIKELQDKFGEHIVNLALIIKNNAEIRRFTAIGIINYLKENKIIKDGYNRISFKWNKFTVISNGLITEYKYSELFFINALVASFTNFSGSAQRTIDKFCETELNNTIVEVVNEEEINNIVETNEKHIANKDIVEEDEGVEQ